MGTGNYTNYPNGVRAGSDGLVLGIGTAEPTKSAYTDLVGAGLTSYGSIWMESDGIHWSYNGTESSITASYSGGAGGAGVGDLDGVYSNGQSIGLDEGAIVLTDATAAAANSMEFVQTGAKSGNIIDIGVNAALTGNAIDIDMNLGIAGKAIYIDNGATARTGSDIQVKSDSSGAHSVIDLDLSGSGAAVGLDIQGSYNGSPAGQFIKLTLDNADNLDTELMQVDTGTGNRGIMFDLNFGHADSGTTSHIFDIDVGGILDSNVFDIAYGAASTGNAINVNLDTAVGATALHVEGSGVRTAPMIEVATDCTGAADLIDVAITGVSSGNIVDIDMGAACTGNVIDIDMNLALAAKAIYLDAGNGLRTADLIDVVHDGSGNIDVMNITATNTGSGAIFDINMNGAGSTSGVFNIDMNAAVGATVMTLDAGAGTRTADMIDVTFDGDGNVGFLDIDCTNTGSGNLIDIDIDGVHTGNALDITYATAASTGDAISVTMGTNVAGSALVISGVGSRTDDLIKIDSSATNSGLVFDINMTGAGSGNVLDITYSAAANTGSAISVTTGTNLAGNAILVTTAGVRTAPVINVVGAGTDAGTDDHIIFVTQSGQLDSDVINITFDTAASTGQAIDINMGTNVAGMALSVASAGTGVSGEGCCLDVEHTGNLVAGADCVTIHSTGDISSTSNLLAIEQDTGAGTAGAYGLYINCTGTNVEAIKVDAGNVVFDEALTVTGTLTQTGVATFATGLTQSAVGRIPTADGTGTGVIAAGTSVVQPTSANADHWLTLPTPVAGHMITILPDVGATGFEVRAADPANQAINNVSGANVELAVAATDTVVFLCVTGGATGSWIAWKYSNLGAPATAGVAGA